jgi:hypothetical protein
MSAPVNHGLISSNYDALLTVLGPLSEIESGRSYHYKAPGDREPGARATHGMDLVVEKLSRPWPAFVGGRRKSVVLKEPDRHGDDEGEQ